MRFRNPIRSVPVSETNSDHVNKPNHHDYSLTFLAVQEVNGTILATRTGELSNPQVKPKLFLLSVNALTRTLVILTEGVLVLYQRGCRNYFRTFTYIFTFCPAQFFASLLCT